MNKGTLKSIADQQKEIAKELHIFQKAIDQTADHVMITDKEGRIEYVNPAFEKTTGYTKDAMLGKTPNVLKSGKQPPEYYRKLWNTILAGEVFFAQTVNKKKNGEFYIADQSISCVRDESGQIVYFVSVWKDITERAKLEERLRIEKQKLEEIIGFDEKISAIKGSDKLMDFVVTKTMQILEAGKCAIMLVDRKANTLCVKGRSGFSDESASSIPIGNSVAAKVIEEGRPLLVEDFEINSQPVSINKDDYVGRSFMIAPIKREDKVIGVINVADKIPVDGENGAFTQLDLKILCDIAREVSVALENARFFKELQYLTTTDPLTSIHNFRHFTTTLDYEILRAGRYHAPLSLLMMDIDDFKSYNDQFGHPEGDKLLKDLSCLILKNLRDVDILCRYAGDEFVIILPGTDKNGSRTLAERIRTAVEKAEFRKSVTLSIGVAEFKSDMTRHELVSKVDRALYQAKKEGKNKVCGFG